MLKSLIERDGKVPEKQKTAYRRQAPLSQSRNYRAETRGTSSYGGAYGAPRYQENMNYRYPGINSTEIRNTQYAGTERLRTGSYESRKSYRAQSGVYQEKRPSSNRRGNSTVNIQDKSYMRGYYPPVYTAPSERPMANGMRTSSVSVYERPLGYTGGTTVTVPGSEVQRKILTREERLENKRKLKARVLSILGIAVIFLMCVLMLYRQSAIFGKNQEIETLNSEYSKILVTNEGIQSSIDKSIELGNLESVAKNQLGMDNPDSSQIFYIDMGIKDEVVKSSSSK